MKDIRKKLKFKKVEIKKNNEKNNKEKSGKICISIDYLEFKTKSSINYLDGKNFVQKRHLRAQEKLQYVEVT